MNRSNNGDKVSLTIGTWAGVITSLVSAIAIPCFALQGRLSTVEAKQDAQQKQIDHDESESRESRREILAAIRVVQQDVRPRVQRASQTE